MYAATVLILWFGGNMILNGALQVGDLTVELSESKQQRLRSKNVPAGAGTLGASVHKRGREPRVYTSYWGRSCSAMTSMPSPVVSAVCTASIAATKALAPESAVTQVTPRRMASVRTL